MLEREAKREKTLESSAREKRIKAQQKRPTSASLRPSATALEELITSADDDFFLTIEQAGLQIQRNTNDPQLSTLNQ
ncbi:hypothetical protein HK096_009706 [Nowakowskiella sp. JEL0078]|nr:hypothetical protein HK096_009706 [Nowakowskiella sp. JEL0078]